VVAVHATAPDCTYVLIRVEQERRYERTGDVNSAVAYEVPRGAERSREFTQRRSDSNPLGRRHCTGLFDGRGHRSDRRKGRNDRIAEAPRSQSCLAVRSCLERQS